jgi:hypothetical protein
MMVRFRAVACAAAAWAGVAAAAQIQICDVQPNIDYTCNNCSPTTNSLPIAVFDFSKQANLSSLKSLDGIEFTMSMQAPVATNSGLRLGLNGIDTGISLDGFARDTLNAKTFSLSNTDANWLSAEKQSALLSSLTANNGEVTASILADNPQNLKLQLYSDTDVKLCLNCSTPDVPTRVPEPAALLTWGLVAAAAAGWRRRTA